MALLTYENITVDLITDGTGDTDLYLVDASNDPIIITLEDSEVGTSHEFIRTNPSGHTIVIDTGDPNIKILWRLANGILVHQSNSLNLPFQYSHVRLICIESGPNAKWVVNECGGDGNLEASARYYSHQGLYSLR